MNLDLLFEDIRTFFPTWHGSLKKKCDYHYSQIILNWIAQPCSYNLPDPPYVCLPGKKWTVLPGPLCVHPERSKLWRIMFWNWFSIFYCEEFVWTYDILSTEYVMSNFKHLFGTYFGTLTTWIAFLRWEIAWPNSIYIKVSMSTIN